MADQQTDPLLDVLLGYAGGLLDEGEGGTQVSISVPVTVFFHGLAVSGTPISEREYYECFGAQMEQGTDKSQPMGAALADAWRTAFSTLAEIAARQGTRSAGQGEAGEPRAEGERQEIASAEVKSGSREFVHLRNARVFGAGLDGMETALWRGRRAEIIGWMLGEVRIR